MKIAIAFLLTLASIDARAQTTFEVGVEMGLYHNRLGDADGSVTGLRQVIDGEVLLFDTVAISAALPFSEIILSGGGDTEARARVGNPLLALYYHLGGETLTLRVGGGLALPVANIPDDDDGLVALVVYGVGLAMNGFQDPWFWLPETMPILLPSLRISADIGLVTLDARGDVVIAVPITETDQRDTEVILPASIGALVHVYMIGIGVRFGATAIATGDDEQDKGQLSLAPVVTADFDPVQLEARLVMNLDDPLGFAFDDEGFFGFFLGVHAVF